MKLENKERRSQETRKQTIFYWDNRWLWSSRSQLSMSASDRMLALHLTRMFNQGVPLINEAEQDTDDWP